MCSVLFNGNVGGSGLDGFPDLGCLGFLCVRFYFEDLNPNGSQDPNNGAFGPKYHE